MQPIRRSRDTSAMCDGVCDYSIPTQELIKKCIQTLFEILQV
jgi:hypothetical protein